MTSTIKRKRPEERTACVVHAETHTVLIVCFVLNVCWFYFLASTSQPTTHNLNPVGLEAVSMSSRRESLEAIGKQDRLFAFTMRDSRRLVPVDPPRGIHIYDYVDIYHADQFQGNSQLYVDGKYIDEEPCQKYLKKYSLACYKEKMIQVFEHALQTQADYYFYIESDNTLCLPLNEIEDLEPEMVLEGTITNVTHFGAFIDIGVHQDALIHISQLADAFVKDPNEIVSVGDITKVKVMEIDIPRKRISVTRRF